MDSLSIRRLRNWEGDRELRKRGIDPRAWKKERKEARLLFQAEIPEKDGGPALKLSCKSKVFQCSSCKYAPLQLNLNKCIYKFFSQRIAYKMFKNMKMITRESLSLSTIKFLELVMNEW